MQAQSAPLEVSRHCPHCTWVSSRPPCRQQGLCVPMAGRTLWQGLSLLAGTFLRKWSHHICGFPNHLSW